MAPFEAAPAPVHSGALQLAARQPDPPELGTARLDRLTTQAIRAWRSGLLARPNLSEATVAKGYRVVRQLLDLAVEARYIAKNPATNRGAATDPEAVLRIPTLDEAVRLVAATPERLRAFVLLAGFTGLRLGDVQALRRRHVDLDKLTVDVEEAVTEPAGQLIVGPQTPAPTPSCSPHPGAATSGERRSTRIGGPLELQWAAPRSASMTCAIWPGRSAP